MAARLGGDGFHLGVLLVLGGSILAGYLGLVVMRRWHVCDVLFLLLVGVVLGPVLGVVSGDVLAPAIPFLAPLGLMVALFEGGLQLAWEDVRRFAGPAVAMCVAAWVLTACSIAIIATIVFGLPPHLSFLFGLAVCATGTLGVLPMLSGLSAPPEARVLLTAEAGLGGILSSVATAAVAAMYVSHASPVSGAFLLGYTFLVGASVGLLAGVLWARALDALTSERHGYALTLAALVTSYVAAETLGGSGLLMALTFGLFVGNAPALVRHGGLRALSPLAPQMRLHQSELIFILRSVYFVYLGLIVAPAIFTWPYLLAGAMLAASLLAARVVAVAATRRRGADRATDALLVAMTPRGLTAA
ncbi:MAG TPA: cation:proton antiporter, partial [Candidatus Thermoplasmatota archaeon]|nr:cation:proton antiporter [Candidatus Thermoplasmatota archaeon]